MPVVEDIGAAERFYVEVLGFNGRPSAHEPAVVRAAAGGELPDHATGRRNFGNQIYPCYCECVNSMHVVSMTKLSKIGVLFLAIRAVSAAPVSYETAFETFKSLQGKWAIQSDGKTLSIEMTYDVGSKGSIVTEQFGKELSVIYRDGQDLLMTHFCNGGNQPRLRLKKSTPPGILEFEMFDITNLKSPDAAHVQRVIYRIVDGHNIDLEIVWRERDSHESEKYTLTKM